MTYLGLPIKKGEEVLGVLTFNNTSPSQYTPEEMILLTSFAAQAAIAIENARQHEAAVRHGAQMDALLRSFRSVTSGLDLQEILDRILTEAAKMVGTEHVRVALVDREARVLRVARVKGDLVAPGFEYPLEGSLSGLVVTRGEPVFRSNPDTDSQSYFGSRYRELSIVSFLGLPIKSGGEVLGVLVSNMTTPREYTPRELAYFTSFADQAAIAIVNARLYEEVTRHAETLEARVQERTAELAQMNLELTAALRQAEAGNQAKNDFLINMSHELRTPLNSILGFAQILQGQAKEGLSDKQRRYLDNIYNSGQHLLGIVNEILDLNTAEAKELALHLTKVNLAEVITEALEATREAVRQKGLSVHALIPPDLPVFDADRDRMRQIAICLLSNAVKFTPAGGSVRVTAQPYLRFAISSSFRWMQGSIGSPGAPANRKSANPKSQLRDFVEIAVDRHRDRDPRRGFSATLPDVRSTGFAPDETLRGDRRRPRAGEAARRAARGHDHGHVRRRGEREYVHGAIPPRRADQRERRMITAERAEHAKNTYCLRARISAWSLLCALCELCGQALRICRNGRSIDHRKAGGSVASRRVAEVIRA